MDFTYSTAVSFRRRCPRWVEFCYQISPYSQRMFILTLYNILGHMFLKTWQIIGLFFWLGLRILTCISLLLVLAKQNVIKIQWFVLGLWYLLSIKKQDNLVAGGKTCCLSAVRISQIGKTVRKKYSKLHLTNLSLTNFNFFFLLDFTLINLRFF